MSALRKTPILLSERVLPAHLGQLKVEEVNPIVAAARLNQAVAFCELMKARANCEALKMVGRLERRK